MEVEIAGRTALKRDVAGHGVPRVEFGELRSVLALIEHLAVHGIQHLEADACQDVTVPHGLTPVGDQRRHVELRGIHPLDVDLREVRQQVVKDRTGIGVGRLPQRQQANGDIGGVRQHHAMRDARDDSQAEVRAHSREPDRQCVDHELGFPFAGSMRRVSRATDRHAG